GANTMVSEINDAFIHPHKGFFVHEAVLDHDEFDSLLDIKGCKPFYVPEKWDLLNYLDECYVQPTQEYTALIYFVKEHFYPENTMDTQNQVILGDGEFLEESVFLNSGLVSDSNIISDVGWVADGWYSAEMLCRDIHGTCKFGGDISDVIWLLDDFGITIENKHQTNELTQLVEEFSEKIRMWEHNGLSRCEIEGLEHMEGEEDVYLEGEGEVGIEGEEKVGIEDMF
ncbi:MAG: hypothetical protein K9L75_06290, partial [Spirochaetia bacterium]|nr:hypothetical protein [Spirochaetia bacterium]